MLLKEVKAERIPDSRGEPTIKVIIDGVAASSPSGKSTGKYETKSYNTSLEFSIDEINKLNFNLEINKFEDLKKVENFICKKFKFRNARQFGANALFALESAILKALAKSKNKQLIIKKYPSDTPVAVAKRMDGLKLKMEFGDFIQKICLKIAVVF